MIEIHAAGVRLPAGEIAAPAVHTELPLGEERRQRPRQLQFHPVGVQARDDVISAARQLPLGEKGIEQVPRDMLHAVMRPHKQQDGRPRPPFRAQEGRAENASSEREPCGFPLPHPGVDRLRKTCAPLARHRCRKDFLHRIFLRSVQYMRGRRKKVFLPTTKAREDVLK